MSLAKTFRRLGITIMWLTSAYVLLTLLIALTEQGRPTAAVFATNLGELFYPEWYANPLVITAVKIAVLTYPASALICGIAFLLSHARLEKPAAMLDHAGNQPAVALSGGLTQAVLPRLPWAEFAAAPSPSPAIAPSPRPQENPESLCILDMAFFIRAIGRNAASVLGMAPNALQRRPFTNFVLPSDIGQLHAAWDRLLSDPQAVITLHLRIRHPNDIVVEADAICRTGFGADGRIVSMTLLPHSERGSLRDQLAAVWY